MSEWADERRRLSAESSAEPGRWITARAEYQRGILDAFSDPLCHTVVVMSSAQVGKTEVLNNLTGYHIDQDPSPMLVVQPTLQMAEAWSKDRLAPMLRDTPTLRGKVKDPRARDSGNTLLHKTFPGGHITMAGANSPASLASRPVRVVLQDEVDRYPPSAGTEGDPVNLAKKRAANFWNRKVGLFSTPTIKGASRIELAYFGSDQRKYWVACPHCGHEQTLAWSQVKWTQVEGRHDPSSARYACSGCAVLWTDAERYIALRSGEWRAEAEFRGIAGFWLNAMYSPWVTLEGLVTDFLEAKRAMDQGDSRLMVVFVNTALGETWEEGGERPDWTYLAGRREKYEAEVPDGALVLVAGVDIQDNRWELEVEGFGSGEESWGIDYRVGFGDPARAEFWRDLDLALQATYRDNAGAVHRISATCIDSGGHHTQGVYEFCKAREHRRIYAVKGDDGAGRAMVSAPKRQKTAQQASAVDLFIVGVDGIKGLIYGRLRVTEPGPGYCHFPAQYPDDWFEQLTAEKLVTRYQRGVPYKTWVLPSGKRNEALDCRVYAYAAIRILSPRWELFERVRAGEVQVNPQSARRVRSRGLQ